MAKKSFMAKIPKMLNYLKSQELLILLLVLIILFLVRKICVGGEKMCFGGEEMFWV